MSHQLLAALGAAVPTTNLHSLPLLARGKVRDIYAVGADRLLMVASDRLSAFDVVMKAPVPGKGRLLTQMALFWFEHLKRIVPNHLTGRSARKRWSRPTKWRRCRGARCSSSASSRCPAKRWCAATWPARAGRNTARAAPSAASRCRPG